MISRGHRKMKRKRTRLTQTVAFLATITFPLPQLPMGLARERADAPEASCNASTVSAEQRSAEALDSLLRQDRDVRTLLEIRDEMTRRAIIRGLSPVALKTAYETKER